MVLGITSFGYKVLEKSKLQEKIDENWLDITQMMPYGAFVDSWEVEDLLEKDLHPERRKRIEEWAEQHDGYSRNPRELFRISGKVTNKLLSREEQNDVQQYGIKNLGELDNLVAAYCLSKRSDDPLVTKSHYSWHNRGQKTRIYGNTHGDLQINQERVEGGEGEIFGPMQDSHINVHYEYWPILTATSLKYAETMDIEIPEAESWREFMKSYGWEGKVKKPYSFGVGYNNFVHDYSTLTLVQLPDKTDIRKIKQNFFGKMIPEGTHDHYYIPVIDLDQNLTFYSTIGGKDKIKLRVEWKEEDMGPIISIPKSDISHLFKGSVNGIMRRQSRTSPQELAFMLWEYEQLKSGKSEDEIAKEKWNLE